LWKKYYNPVLKGKTKNENIEEVFTALKLVALLAALFLPSVSPALACNQPLQMAQACHPHHG